VVPPPLLSHFPLITSYAFRSPVRLSARSCPLSAPRYWNGGPAKLLATWRKRKEIYSPPVRVPPAPLFSWLAFRSRALQRELYNCDMGQMGLGWGWAWAGARPANTQLQTRLYMCNSCWLHLIPNSFRLTLSSRAVLQGTLPRSTPASKGPDYYTVAVHPFDEVNGNEPFVSTRPDNEIDLQTATFRFSILGWGGGDVSTWLLAHVQLYITFCTQLLMLYKCTSKIKRRVLISWTANGCQYCVKAAPVTQTQTSSCI
jgi:hypothetical protein